MYEAQVDALLTAADDDGVDFERLVVSQDEQYYSLKVAGFPFQGLDADGVRERLAQYPDHVGNWYFWHHEVPPGDDRYAFLRWLEDGVTDNGGPTRTLRDHVRELRDGWTATWGQLHVTVELQKHGIRRYTLRHVDDVEGEDAVDPEELETFDDPLDARQLAKLDDEERYRPLKTAPTLQRGWQFPELDADELVRAVECFYPATIPNWYREQQGELDVDHWRDTAERQTGIYDVIEQLPREAVEWVAESCCVDSECLKRREWQYEEGDGLEAEGGEGTFPCREPCSLVVAAARKWTILEGETERTYEFELTPTEKHQLEELIDAVADGRIDEIREADVGDGANRYRARYLRAKRFDEEGNLCGVTEGTHDEKEDHDDHDDHDH